MVDRKHIRMVRHDHKNKKKPLHGKCQETYQHLPPTLSSVCLVYHKTNSPVSAFFTQCVTCAAGSLYFWNQNNSEYLNVTERLSTQFLRAPLGTSCNCISAFRAVMHV